PQTPRRVKWDSFRSHTNPSSAASLYFSVQLCCRSCLHRSCFSNLVQTLLCAPSAYSASLRYLFPPRFPSPAQALKLRQTNLIPASVSIATSITATGHLRLPVS